MTRVAIAYGWAEGPWLSKRLRKELRTAGFKTTRSLKRADMIVAHSGGCLMLPRKSDARLVLLVGLPFWPGKHPLRSAKEKLRSEIKDIWWYRKTLHNTVYFVTHPSRWIRMWRRWKKDTLPQYVDTTIIALRNDEDQFLHPVEVVTLAKSKGWHLKTLPGQHDDIWKNPKPYVDLVKKHYGLLAETD